MFAKPVAILFLLIALGTTLLFIRPWIDEVNLLSATQELTTVRRDTARENLQKAQAQRQRYDQLPPLERARLSQQIPAQRAQDQIIQELNRLSGNIQLILLNLNFSSNSPEKGFTRLGLTANIAGTGKPPLTGLLDLLGQIEQAPRFYLVRSFALSFGSGRTDMTLNMDTFAKE